jgi:hypothetical protein
MIEHLALGGYSGGRPQSESRVVEKIAAHISEENFWAPVSTNKSELKLILFTGDEKPNSADMDALAVIPEINETLKIQMCQTEPAIILGGSANSDFGKVEAIKYLGDELARYADFVAHSKKSETIVRVISDPSKLFSSDAAFNAKRIDQIKAALGALVHERPLALRVSSFSKLTDQIEVLVPPRGEAYTMSVIHSSCSDESVEVGREIPLKSIRPDLRRKIEVHSISAPLN